VIRFSLIERYPEWRILKTKRPIRETGERQIAPESARYS